MFVASRRRASRAVLRIRAGPRPALRVVRAPPARDALERLEALAESGGALRRVVAALAGRLVERRAWERLGYARLSDYARERLGLAARSVQDLARTDAALAGLPRVEAALVGGTLTWTEARLLCRVATSADEPRWLAFARGTSARALARAVRAVDVGSLEAGAAQADEDGIPEDARETLAIRCTPGVQARWHSARQLARRVAGEALPVWECMETIAAEVLSAFPLDAQASAAAVCETGCETGETRACAPTRGAANGCESQGRPGNEPHPEPAPDTGTDPRARPVLLPAPLAPLVADLEHADAFALDARLRAALTLEQRLAAKLAPLLLQVARERLYRHAGCRSLEEYARERLGLAPRKVRMLLRLERAGDVCPELRRAFREGRISWVQAHALLPVLVPEHAERFRARWIAHAQRVSVRRLQDDVAAALASGVLDPTGRQTGADPSAAGRDDPGSQREAETARVFWNGPVASTRFFRAALCSLRRRLPGTPSEGQALDAMLEHVFHAWRSPGAPHPVFDRDGWRCTVPGCSSYKNLHDHHVVFRSQGGSNELSNRTTLCAWHHLRGVHRGIVRCAGHAPDRLRFELGVRSGRPPLVAYEPGERITASV